MNNLLKSNQIIPTPLPKTKDFIKAKAVDITADNYNRSLDWVYKVLRGDIINKNTKGVIEFYNEQYRILSNKMR